MLLIVEIILRRWNLLAEINFTVLLILTLITELSWHSPVGPGGDRHIGGVLGSLLLLVLVHFTCYVYFTLQSAVVRLLTVLVRRRIQLGAYCFLKDDSTCIRTIPFLSESG